MTSSVCLAGPSEQIIGGFANSGAGAGYPTGEAGAPKIQFADAWVRYTNGMLLLMGFLFMVMIIFAGYLWMTAHGKEEQVTRAKHLIINVTIGLGVVIAARIIVELVLFYLGQTIK